MKKNKTKGHNYFDHLLNEGEKIARGPIQFWELYPQYPKTEKEKKLTEVHDFLAIMIPEWWGSTCAGDAPFFKIPREERLATALKNGEDMEGDKVAYVIWDTKLNRFIEPHTSQKGENKKLKAHLQDDGWYTLVIRDDQHLVSLNRVKKLCPQLLQHPWVKTMVKKYGVHELLPYDEILTDDGIPCRKKDYDEYMEEMKNSEENKKLYETRIKWHRTGVKFSLDSSSHQTIGESNLTEAQAFAKINYDGKFDFAKDFYAESTLEEIIRVEGVLNKRIIFTSSDILNVLEENKEKVCEFVDAIREAKKIYEQHKNNWLKIYGVVDIYPSYILSSSDKIIPVVFVKYNNTRIARIPEEIQGVKIIQYQKFESYDSHFQEIRDSKVQYTV